MYYKKILIRMADESDCLDILSWRNNKISSKMSANTKMISLDSHKSWFFQVLNDNNTVMYIGQYDNQKVGVCRFEFNKLQLVSEVSINMNPKLRGKGYGKLFLKSSIAKYIKDHKNDIIAKVRFENLPSIKIFTYTGFKVTKEKDNMVYFKKSIKGN